MCKKPSDTERELNSSIPLDLMEHVLKGMNVGPLHSHLACSFIYCLMAPFGPAASTCILMYTNGSANEPYSICCNPIRTCHKLDDSANLDFYVCSHLRERSHDLIRDDTSKILTCFLFQSSSWFCSWPSGCGSVEERLTRVRGIPSSTPGTVWGFSENSILEWFGSEVTKSYSVDLRLIPMISTN